MKKQNDPFEGVFDTLQDKSLLTNKQKEKMLNYVLMESQLQETTFWGKVGRWITVYPWRFAFSTAAAQAIAFTLIFGTGYTNLLLSFFGG